MNQQGWCGPAGDQMLVENKLN